MIKWLTTVVRLACIVRLNHERNAAFSRPWDHQLSSARCVARVKRKCAATRGRLYT